MLVRLGHVFGWVGNILGGLFVAGGIVNYFHVYQWIVSKLTGDRTVYDPVLIAQLNFLVEHDLDSADGLKGELLSGWLNAAAAARRAQLEQLISVLVAGVVIFLIGHGLRYVFAGPVRQAHTRQSR